MSDFDTGCLMEKEKNMNLEEKIKKSDMDLEKAKRRLVETMDPEEEHQNSATMEPAEPAPEQQNSDSSGYGF